MFITLLLKNFQQLSICRGLTPNSSPRSKCRDGWAPAYLSETVSTVVPLAYAAPMTQLFYCFSEMSSSHLLWSLNLWLLSGMSFPRTFNSLLIQGSAQCHLLRVALAYSSQPSCTTPAPYSAQSFPEPNIIT